MDQRLSLVTLGVQDLARSRAFYESLGWRASAASCEQVCLFQTGSMALALYPIESLLGDSGKAGAAPAPGRITLGINVSLRDNVDRELAAVLSLGATLYTVEFFAHVANRVTPHKTLRNSGVTFLRLCAHSCMATYCWR